MLDSQEILVSWDSCTYLMLSWPGISFQLQSHIWFSPARMGLLLMALFLYAKILNPVWLPICCLFLSPSNFWSSPCSKWVSKWVSSMEGLQRSLFQPAPILFSTSHILLLSIWYICYFIWYITNCPETYCFPKSFGLARHSWMVPFIDFSFV